MKFKYLLFTSFALLCLNGLAQQITAGKDLQHDIIDEAEIRVKCLSDIRILDSLIDSKKISDPELIAGLYIDKAYYLLKFSKNDYSSGVFTREDSVEAGSVLECYRLAIETSSCRMETEARYNRYNYLRHLIEIFGNQIGEEAGSLYEKDLEFLKTRGFKPGRDGLGAGVHYSHGRHDWIGFKISLFTMFEHTQEFHNHCDGGVFVYSPKEFASSLSAFTFGYSRSSLKSNDFSFSFIDLVSPFALSPFNLGIMVNDDFNHPQIYYRPSIGVSIYGAFLITYSYNLMLNKKDRPGSEKSMINFSLTYPVTNHRKVRWQPVTSHH